MLKFSNCKQTGLELILSPKTNKQTPATLWSTVTANTVWEYLFQTEWEWKSPPAGCWFKTLLSHSTWSPAISPQEVLLWHRFWQGGWFSHCFQMFCDKLSKTLKHHPSSKKEVIRCAHSEVSLSSTITLWHSPLCSTTGTQACHCSSNDPGELKQRWKSHDQGSSLKERGLVQFSQRSLFLSAGQDLTTIEPESWERYLRSTVQRNSGHKSKWQDCRDSK